jgi:hypothetical protein
MGAAPAFASAEPEPSGTVKARKPAMAAAPGFLRASAPADRQTSAFAIDRSRRRFYTRPGEPVAQMVEHLTFNQVVDGSIPSGLTKLSQ